MAYGTYEWRYGEDVYFLDLRAMFHFAWSWTTSVWENVRADEEMEAQEAAGRQHVVHGSWRTPSIRRGAQRRPRPATSEAEDPDYVPPEEPRRSTRRRRLRRLADLPSSDRSSSTVVRLPMSAELARRLAAQHNNALPEGTVFVDMEGIRRPPTAVYHYVSDSDSDVVLL